MSSSRGQRKWLHCLFPGAGCRTQVAGRINNRLVAPDMERTDFSIDKMRRQCSYNSFRPALSARSLPIFFSLDAAINVNLQTSHLATPITKK